MAALVCSHYPGASEDQEDLELVKKLREIVYRHRRYGYRPTWVHLQPPGWRGRRKRIRRLWRKLGLCVPRWSPRKRLRKRASLPLRARRLNHVWTYDFIGDARVNRRASKIPPIMDEFRRESEANAEERHMSAAGVTQALGATFSERGAPEYLWDDNGPGFIRQSVREWLSELGTETRCIDPGSPWHNAFGEGLSDKLPGECLKREGFETVAEARGLIGRSLREYNEGVDVVLHCQITTYGNGFYICDKKVLSL